MIVQISWDLPTKSLLAAVRDHSLVEALVEARQLVGRQAERDDRAFARAESYLLIALEPKGRLVCRLR